jgi:hypothetical protein
MYSGGVDPYSSPVEFRAKTGAGKNSALPEQGRGKIDDFFQKKIRRRLS